MNVRSLAPSWLKAQLAASRKPATMLMLLKVLAPMCHALIESLRQMASIHSHDTKAEQGQETDFGIPQGIASEEERNRKDEYHYIERHVDDVGK
jgi:hypothetical protein